MQVTRQVTCTVQRYQKIVYRLHGSARPPDQPRRLFALTFTDIERHDMGDAMHYLMFYEFAPDYLERRTPVRAEHLEHAWQAVARGELLLGGPLADPVDRGVLLFQCDSPDILVQFAEADPYVKHGVVTRYEVRPWTTVVGEEAFSPVRLGA